MKQAFLRVYAGLFSAIFSVVLVAQCLSFTGLYRAWLAIPLVVIVSIVAYSAYQRAGLSWRETLSGADEEDSPILRYSILFSCIAILAIVFVQRLILWHQSTAGAFISADFAGYHSIKALQLFRDGSFWNLAIPYGQYPSGYESLISFGMFFTGDIRITGMIHAIVAVLFWMTIVLLIVRYAKLSPGASMMLALLVCFLPVVFSQLMNPGKNDILLSLTVLIAILHAPIMDERFHPYGLAFATMLSLAIKATGLYVLFYLWGLLMLNWGIHFRKGSWREYLHPLTFIIVIAVMFPGGLWVIRNYIVLDALYSPEIESFFATTIIANLNNPALYNSAGSPALAFASAVIAITAILALFRGKSGWQMSGLILIIALTFMTSPLSVFLTLNDLDRLDVQWRFVIHGFVVIALVLIMIITPLVHRLYACVVARRILQYGSAMLVLSMIPVVIVAIGVDDIFGRNPQNWDVIVDPTLQENSIYDELANLEPGVLYIERINWLAASLNNPEMTITELRYPLGQAEIYPVLAVDYIAFSPRENLPEPTISIFTEYSWDIIFDNPTGRIYRLVD